MKDKNDLLLKKFSDENILIKKNIKKNIKKIKKKKVEKNKKIFEPEFIIEVKNKDNNKFVHMILNVPVNPDEEHCSVELEIEKDIFLLIADELIN